MKNTYLISIAAVTFLIIGGGIWHFSQNTNATALERFSECGSLANGSTQTVTETSRVFINLPKDLYPNVNLQIASHGATAGSISNGGPYGSAIGAQGKPNCWSYYFEFDGVGTVDLASKSVTSGTPDYAIHFVVTSATSTQPQGCTQEAKQCADGSYVGRTGPNCTFAVCPTPHTSTSGISGVAMLGPTCPVERNPPDPQCADRAYQGNFVLTTLDGTRVIKTFSSDANGKFTFPVSSGAYLIRSAPSSSAYPRCSSTGTIQVVDGAYATAAISCDTGIR